MTAVRTDLKTGPQLLHFRQPMPAGRPSRYFVAAVFASVVMHAFLAFLLWVVVTDRTAVETTAPSIGTPMIVSLVSLPTLATAFHDGPDREAVSAVPHTGHSQSSPERSRSAERKAEAESVVLSKGQGVPGSEAPEAKSFATDVTPSIDLGAAYRIAREVGRMPKLETQSPRLTSTELYLKNHLGITRKPRPDCRTEHAGKEYLAIPYLLKDDSGCEWKRQEDRERQGDPGRLNFFMDEINDLVLK